MLVKNIEQKIKINKAVSIASILFAVVIVIVGFVFAYQLIKDSRKSLYVIDNGVPILVKQTDELLNRPVEYKSQVESVSYTHLDVYKRQWWNRTP